MSSLYSYKGNNMQNKQSTVFDDKFFSELNGPSGRCSRSDLRESRQARFKRSCARKDPRALVTESDDFWGVSSPTFKKPTKRTVKKSIASKKKKEKSETMH